MLNAEHGSLLHVALAFLGSTLDWHLIAQSGWPLFIFLARLHRTVFGSVGDSNPFTVALKTHWSIALPFVESVERDLNEQRPIDVVKSEAILKYPQTVVAPFTLALAYLSCAVATKADIAGMRSLTSRAAEIVNEHWLGPSKRFAPMYIFAARWPIFRVADRLGCREKVKIRLPPSADGPNPIFFALPFRERVSDFIRACRIPYCDFSFIELALLLAPPPLHLHLVEVGANLGDCTGWVSAHFGSRLLSAIALEPFAELVTAFKRTVAQNKWQHRINVMEAAASNVSGQGDFFLIGRSLGNAFAYAAASPHPIIENSARARVNFTDFRDIVRAHRRFQQHHRRNDTKRMSILKLWVFSDVLKLIFAAPHPFALNFDAVWMAFPVNHFRRPGQVLSRIAAYFSRQGLILTAPSLDARWCMLSRHGALRAIRRAHDLISSQPQGWHVLQLVAFVPTKMHCPYNMQTSSHKMVLKNFSGHLVGGRTAPDAPVQCFLGLSALQKFNRKVGHDFDTYFLGEDVVQGNMRAPLWRRFRKDTDS